MVIGEAFEYSGVNIIRLTFRGNGICFEGMDVFGKGILMLSMFCCIDFVYNGFGD